MVEQQPESDPILAAVRAELDRRGWSANELARRSGVSQPTITRWFAGERGISLPALLQLVDALGLELVIRKRRGR